MPSGTESSTTAEFILTRDPDTPNKSCHAILGPDRTAPHRMCLGNSTIRQHFGSQSRVASEIGTCLLSQGFRCPTSEAELRDKIGH